MRTPPSATHRRPLIPRRLRAARLAMTLADLAAACRCGTGTALLGCLLLFLARRAPPAASPRAAVRPAPPIPGDHLAILLDARGEAGPGTTVAGNALCWFERAGLLGGGGGGAAAGAPLVTLLAPSPAAADIFNVRWGDAGGRAVVGGAAGGRALAAAALSAGRGFVVTPPSALWLEDARRALFSVAAGGAGHRPGVQVNATCDVVVGGGEEEEEGGRGGATSSPILAVRPTPGGRAFFAAAAACEVGRAAGGRAGRWGGPGSAGEPLFTVFCLDLAAAVAAADGPVACALDPSLFPPSLAALDAAGPGVSGLWPAAIRVPVDIPPADLADRGLWALAPGGGCAASPPLDQGPLAAALAPPHPPHPAAARLKIRVLTMARPDSLARLLGSLVAADYGGRGGAGGGGRATAAASAPPLPLEVAVDAPADPADGPAHAATLALLASFTWPHGPLTLDIAHSPRGLAGQWLAWRPTAGDEACLVLEDDVEVGAGWAAWLAPLLAAYWADAAPGPGQAAAYLAAISLSHQNKVVGEVAGGVQAYGVPDGVAAPLEDGGGPASTPVYLAAQASSWGVVLLPRPWAHFLDWYGSDRGRGALPRPASPCLPGLASNQWWARSARSGGMWTAWWHAFAARAGYVTLYARPRVVGGSPPQAINHKEPGEHFKEKVAPDGELGGGGRGGAGGAAARPSHDHHASHPPPPFATLPVYDLHMRPVGPAGGPGGVGVLAGRAALAGGFGDGGCAWVGMSSKERAWLAGWEEEEGDKEEEEEEDA